MQSYKEKMFADLIIVTDSNIYLLVLDFDKHLIFYFLSRVTERNINEFG